MYSSRVMITQFGTSPGTIGTWIRGYLESNFTAFYSDFTNRIYMFDFVAYFNRIVDFCFEKVKSSVKIIWPKNFELVTALTVQIAICDSDAKIGPLARLNKNLVWFDAVEFRRSSPTLSVILFIKTIFDRNCSYFRIDQHNCHFTVLYLDLQLWLNKLFNFNSSSMLHG